MSILGLMQNAADDAQTTPNLSALPSTIGDRFGPAWDAAQSPDRYWNADSARAARADKIIDDLHAMTGEKLLNPFGIGNTPTTEEVRENVGQPMSVIYAKRLEKLREKTKAAKAGMEQFGGLPQDYLDVDSIDTSIAAESRQRRAADDRLEGTGGWLGAFAGSSLGEMASPHGVASAFIPVSRLPTAIIETTLAGFARNVGREALFQAGAGMAVQAAGSAIDYQTRKAFGTEQTTAEIVEEILGAGVGGAILGGTFRGVHLGILKLASRGVEIHPAVKDAAILEQGADLHGTKNPLGLHPGVNESNIDAAVSNAALGRAATPDLDVAVPSLHDAARRLDPALMARYDAAIAARDEARSILAPDSGTIERLKQRMDDADSAIAAAGPSTQAQAEVLGNRARMAREVYQDAVARVGATRAPETPVSTSMRQQLQAADIELRDLIPEINKVMRAAGEDMAAPARAILAPDAEAGTVESRLTPDEISRVRELQEQIPEYERFRDAAASPEDKAAWQAAIDDFHGEIAKIMDLDVVRAGLKQLAPAMSQLARGESTPVLDARRPFMAQPEAPTAGRPAGITPEDKALESQVKLLLDAPPTDTGGATAAQREAWQRALDDEKQANVALSCVGGAPI